MTRAVYRETGEWVDRSLCSGLLSRTEPKGEGGGVKKAEEIAGRKAPQPHPSLRDPGLALCLSGGGYRAMLFHAGSLRRLNDLGMLSTLSRVSSVSGGSIAAASLATHWSELDFDDEGIARRLDLVEGSLFDLAGRTVDAPSVVAGVVPGRTAASALAVSYRRHLLGRATLQDLPDSPRFTFNTTNMMSGRLMRWSKPYVADYTVGAVFSPGIPLASVVAASSAFPPFASPLVLRSVGPFVNFNTREPVLTQPKRLVLTDGGVYDNLGLQPVESFHTVLVSDGGAPSAYGRWLFKDWLTQSLRTLRIIDSQVRSLRRRHLVQDFIGGARLGALWTISAVLEEYPVSGSVARGGAYGSRTGRSSHSAATDGAAASQATYQLGLRGRRRGHSQLRRVVLPSSGCLALPGGTSWVSHLGSDVLHLTRVRGEQPVGAPALRGLDHDDHGQHVRCRLGVPHELRAVDPRRSSIRRVTVPVTDVPEQRVQRNTFEVALQPLLTWLRAQHVAGVSCIGVRDFDDVLHMHMAAVAKADEDAPSLDRMSPLCQSL